MKKRNYKNIIGYTLIIIFLCALLHGLSYIDNAFFNYPKWLGWVLGFIAWLYVVLFGEIIP